jgi:GntR family transcriptional regulator / MocR family aminotransferase
VLRAEGRDLVAMEDPCLSDHRAVVRAAGMRIAAVSADTRGAHTELLAATGAHLAVLGPAHQFPLGAVLHPERRAAAVAWARATGGLLLEDDYDAELRYDRQPVGALQALDPDHVVYAGTVSKTLAPALRIGWLVVPPRLLEPLTALRACEDVQPSAMDQIAFAELLRSGAFEHHVRRMRTRYRRRRDRLVAVLAERAPAVAPVGISAGLRVLLQLPRGAPPATELARRAAERSVGLFPVGPYHHDGRPVRDGIVAGYAALPEHDFEAGLTALGDLLAV